MDCAGVSHTKIVIIPCCIPILITLEVLWVAEIPLVQLLLISSVPLPQVCANQAEGGSSSSSFSSSFSPTTTKSTVAINRYDCMILCVIHNKMITQASASPYDESKPFARKVIIDCSFFNAEERFRIFNRNWGGVLSFRLLCCLRVMMRGIRRFGNG